MFCCRCKCMLDFIYLPSYLGMVLALSFQLISATTKAGNFFLLCFFFYYFFKQKTSLSLTHSTEGNGALKKTTKYGQTHGQGAAAGGPARSPRHWGFLICPGMVHHWELLITFQQYSPWCDGIHNSNQEKERTEALSSSPRQGVEVKKHPGQFSRKDFAIPPSSKSHLPNSRVRGRNDTSGTVFF